MATLYERLEALCAQRGIRGGRMCTELGISKSLMTDLKTGRKKTVNAGTAQKLAAYFGVSVGNLREKKKRKGLPNPADPSVTRILNLLSLGATARSPMPCTTRCSPLPPM